MAQEAPPQIQAASVSTTELPSKFIHGNPAKSVTLGVVVQIAGSVEVVKTVGPVVVIKTAGPVVVVKTVGPVVVVEACSQGVVVVVAMVVFGCQVVVDLAWLFFMVCGRFKSPRPVKLISCLSLSGDGIESPLTPTRWSIIFTRADLSSLSCSCTA